MLLTPDRLLRLPAQPAARADRRPAGARARVASPPRDVRVGSLVVSILFVGCTCSSERRPSPTIIPAMLVPSSTVPPPGSSSAVRAAEPPAFPMPARSPASKLLCSPPTPPYPSAAAPVSPCRRPTSVRMLLLCGATLMASAGRACIRERAARRRRITGSPSLRIVPRRYWGLPVAWTVLLLRAVVVHPVGCGLPSPCCGEIAVAFGQSNALGTRDDIVFVAAFPTAHMLARLRIAGRARAPRPRQCRRPRRVRIEQAHVPAAVDTRTPANTLPVKLAHRRMARSHTSRGARLFAPHAQSGPSTPRWSASAACRTR